MNYTIDATNKSLGRLAAEVASILMGKNNPNFKRNVVSENKVTVTNISKIKSDPRKMLAKKYKSFSGYPGGLKEVSMEKVIDKKGYSEIFNIAVKGMLPNNRLRKSMLSNLVVTE